MKKILGLLAVIVGVLIVFGIVSKRAEANKAVFGTGLQDDKETAKRISLDILRDKASLRSIGKVDDYEIQKVDIDELKMAHTRVRQIVDGVRVWEGEAIVHLKSDGELSTITDDLKEGIAVNTTPNFTADEAISAAKTMYKGSRFLTEAPVVDLWIYRGEDRDHLAYRVQMRREDGTKNTAMPVIFVDAQTGEKVFGYDNLQTGTGSSLYSGTVNIGTNGSGSSFFMENLTRFAGTFNYTNGTSTASRFTDANDIWDSTTQRAGVDAQFGQEATLNYYQTIHNRNGIDGSGGPRISSGGSTAVIQSRVHYSSNYNNAFWNGSYMTYGDGDGTTFSPLVTLDIAGHEMTHGVTERTANLTYARESGGLNESMSDIFGAMVESFARGGVVDADTWKIGEQAYTPANGTGDALRSMSDPPSAGDPDHYSERLYPGTCTPSNANDQCGVHSNSGISNKAFFLAVAGGTHPQSGVTVTGIAANDAARIFYRGLTVYMTASTNFAGARTATLNAATDLFGSASTQYTTITNAWCAVGVGACAGAPTPTPTPTPTPGGGAELLTNGGFEGSVSPWVSSGTGAFYTNAGSYPHGGTGYIYFGVNNSVSGQSYQTVSIPAAASGAFTFWLNVTSSETTTTTQYDKLFVEVRNTAGTLLSTVATYSNLNKTTAGNYSQKSFSLAAYKGQTVRVQFRSTMDSSITSTFRVDDASLK